jgi:nucleotide-binding universal stress UspA family protein
MAQSNPSTSSAVASSGPTAQPTAFARVLVPIDFSPASRAALVLAERMTAPWGSEIILFGAPGMSENDSFLQGTGASWGKSDVLDEAREHLRSFGETIIPSSKGRFRAEARRDEDLTKSIVNAVADLDASLLIMGEIKAMQPRWRRSRVERIARAVPCPVLVVPY